MSSKFLKLDSWLHQGFMMACCLYLSSTLCQQTALGQAGFGFLQSNNNSNGGFGNNFGSANAWVNGYSQALMQVPQFQQTPGMAPQLAPMQRAFQLGANIENTTTGVRILDVMPNSIAKSIGLNRGDIVINVSGYQVGIVNERIYDVVDEIQKRMQANGFVNVLVQSGSNGSLAMLQINPNSATTPSVSGTVRLPNNQSLPNGVTLRVELKNVSRPYQQIYGGADVHTVSGYGPFAYEIRFDPRYIDPQDQYQVVASVSSAWQTYFQGAQSISPTNPGLNNLDLQLQPAQSQVVQAGSTTTVGYAPNPNVVIAEFQKLLNRQPDSGELQAWVSSLQRGDTLDSMRSQLLSSRQFYDMAGNNDLGYVRRLVQVVQNRNPTEQEMSSLISLLSQNQSRQALAQQVLSLRR